MSYAITNAKGLAGIGHPQTPRTVAPAVLGGIPGDVSPTTVDGTTTGEREMMIAALSMQVVEWQAQVNKALAGDLSFAGIVNNAVARGVGSPLGLLFVPSAYTNRQLMLKAKTDLASFLVDAQVKLRNYQQPTAATMQYLVSVLDIIGQQIGVSITSEARNTLFGLAREVKKQTVNNANALLKAAQAAGKGATEGVFPWWAGPVAGVFVLAYLWNTFRLR